MKKVAFLFTLCLVSFGSIISAQTKDKPTTTTLPSAGEITELSFLDRFLIGLLKN
jgi:hypothetical protein